MRFKVRRDACAWLNAAAVEVNQVWNYCNETSCKAARPFVGPAKWLSGFDLCKLTAGATEYFEQIGADTIQRVNREFAAKRAQAKKVKLRWRVSRGSKRALGWIPFKAASLRRQGRYVRFCGKTIRVFERERLGTITKWKCGCFAEDALGDWWLCLPVERVDATPAATSADVGIDLGLKDTAVTSDGDRLEAGRFYRNLEPKIVQAQRRRHKKYAKRLCRRATNRRKDAPHKFSRVLVNRYQHIVVGDVSSLKLAKTRMAKSVLDAGWGKLRTNLQYKGRQAGRSVKIVSEMNTSRACSSCRALTGPTGVNGLRVRQGVCSECGDTHDRDVNAARNIPAEGRLPPSVSGNESSDRSACLRRAARPRKARTAPIETAA